MDYSKVRAREKFRYRSGILFYSGLIGWGVWFLIIFMGPTGDLLGAIGGLAIIIAIIGTYAGGPLMIRTRYGAEEPTPWKVPGGVAAAILAFVLVFGFIPTATAQNTISLMGLILIPVFIYTLIWMIVLLVRQRARSSANGESNNETWGN